jgi:hypothetical protein
MATVQRPGEAMWQQVALWRREGLTYAQVTERLSEPAAMLRFHLRDVPGEATIRRELRRVLGVAQGATPARPSGPAPQAPPSA